MARTEREPEGRGAGRWWSRIDLFRLGSWAFLVLGLVTLLAIVHLLRFSAVTDYAYHALVKDPERIPATGDVVVSPADGTVLYVREVTDGVIPEVVKNGVRVPVVDHLKTEPARAFERGYLIGIYMNTQGVHVNRMPNHGSVVARTVFNGPHLDMSAAERRIILTQMVPGLVTLRKLLGLAPHDIEHEADFVLDSARETLTIRDERGAYLYVVRIADYYVGKILTWVSEDQQVARGERIGMITWGSQTDLFIEATPGLEVRVTPGEYVYGGETVVATY